MCADLIVGKIEGTEDLQAVAVDVDGRLVVTPVALLTVAIAYSGANAEYVGWAAVGSAQGATVWRIMKITYDGSGKPTDVKWADGVTTFSKEWDERTGYSYS